MSDALSITHRLIANPPHQRYNETEFQRRARTRVIDRIEFLKRLPLFANLNQSELSGLAKDFVAHRFRQGETIFFQGDYGQNLYLMESGQVRIYVQDDRGQETSVNFCSAGDIFGELAAIDGLPRSATVVAIEDTAVWTITRDQLRAHLQAAPQLAYNFMQALSVRVRYTSQQVGSLTMLDVPSRLAYKLLELAQNHGRVESDGLRINLALTQSDLASAIGATRESSNKVLGQFKRSGYIRMAQKQITLLDPDALREISS